MIWLLELMRDYALKEKYNIKMINNKIKENRMLFEIGEITEKEYERLNGETIKKGKGLRFRGIRVERKSDLT